MRFIESNQLSEQSFETADAAMKMAVGLRAAHIDFVIYDAEGTILSVGQLAAIVIEQQLRASGSSAKIV